MAKRVTKYSVIGSAAFANGTSFQIEQAIQRKPAFRVVNTYDGRPIAHSKSIDACWRAIRYAARISHKTERSAI